jgi:hypothetical protein
MPRVKALAAIAIGYIVGAKSGAKDLDRLSRSLHALFDTDEFSDVIGVARAQVGTGLREIAALIDGQHPVPEGAADIVAKVRNLVEHKVNRPQAP